MAENIEFIPAKDLPKLEAKEVDVLVVDPATGALGRQPGASLGEGYDAVILVQEWYDEPNDTYGVTFTLESGSYEDLVRIITSAKVPKVLLHGTLYYGGEFPYVEEIRHGCVDGEQVSIERSYAWAINNYSVYIHSDNTVDYTWRES